MWLTGRPDGPPSVAPAPLASAMEAAAADLCRETARWGRAVEVDGPALLGERAAITGMTRNGDTSVGGAARFIAVADGWVALNLPRPEDVASLPALVGAAIDPGDWPAVARGLAALTTEEVVARAALLGLAVGAPGRRRTRPASPVSVLSGGGPRTRTDRPLVVDLGSLWAAPLAAQLLGAAGARVVKVEGRHRPDGARRGSRAFFDLLNHGKECVSIDVEAAEERGFLRRLLAGADLVIEGSRPRVMEHLGIDPAALAAAGTSWLSITAHGRTGEAANRIGFGDDAAVEGGLFVAGDPPGFVADAVADPLTGLVAAAFGAELLAGDRSAVVEAPLARAASWAARPPVEAPVVRAGDGWAVEVDGRLVEVAPPRHRPIPSAAPALGAHDEALRAEFPG